MSDYIDRQAVLNALKEHRSLFCNNTPETFSKLSYAEKSRVDELDTAIATIINLPSAENKGEWIPVSEENLPEDFQEVLVTVVRYDGTRAVRAAVYHENRSLSRKTFRILENNERWDVGEEGLIAWMPKPEPYKAESEDKE